VLLLKVKGVLVAGGRAGDMDVSPRATSVQARR